MKYKQLRFKQKTTKRDHRLRGIQIITGTQQKGTNPWQISHNYVLLSFLSVLPSKILLTKLTNCGSGSK